MVCMKDALPISGGCEGAILWNIIEKERRVKVRKKVGEERREKEHGSSRCRTK